MEILCEVEDILLLRGENGSLLEVTGIRHARVIVTLMEVRCKGEGEYSNQILLGLHRHHSSSTDSKVG